MTLFETVYQGHLWRLEVVEYRERRHVNWRCWYLTATGWKPTKKGCTFPLHRLSDLAADNLVLCETRRGRRP